VKTILRTSLLISLILAMTACALPEVTPEPTPTTAVQPTSTAPVIPVSPTVTETPASTGQVITAANAAQLQAADRTASSNAQALVWSQDSQTISLISQNSSTGTDQVFSDALLAVPSLAPDLVYAAVAGAQRMVPSPDGKTVAVMPADNTQVDLIDVASKTILQTLEPGYPVNTVGFSPDGKTVSISSQDAWQVTLFDAATGQKTQTLSGFETAAPVYDAGFSGTNNSIVWHARGTLQVQDIQTQALGPTLSHEDFISGVAFSLSPDGKLLASASMKTINGTFEPVVYLWDPAIGTYLDGLVLQAAGTALAFSPDGSLLAVAAENAIEIWDVAAKTRLATLTDNPNPVYLLAFSPDGRWLASSGYENQLILFAIGQ